MAQKLLAKSGDYEQTLKEEMDRLSASFKKKLALLQKEIENVKLDNLKEVNQIKKQLDKESEVKRLLIKKLDLYID